MVTLFREIAIYVFSSGKFLSWFVLGHLGGQNQSRRRPNRWLPPQSRKWLRRGKLTNTTHPFRSSFRLRCYCEEETQKWEKEEPNRSDPMTADGAALPPLRCCCCPIDGPLLLHCRRRWEQIGFWMLSTRLRESRAGGTIFHVRLRNLVRLEMEPSNRTCLANLIFRIFRRILNHCTWMFVLYLHARTCRLSTIRSKTLL